MSTLIVDELFAGVVFSQKIQIKKGTDIAFIRPWIYKHGTLVDGELTLRIKRGATTLKTVSIDFSDINSAITSDFAHGYIRFDTAPLTLNITDTEVEEQYILEFEMTNHTTDVDNFIGIVRSWEDPIYVEDPQSLNDTTAGCGIELYNFKENL